jgi:hypothetical protein
MSGAGFRIASSLERIAGRTARRAIRWFDDGSTMTGDVSPSVTTA